MGHPAPRADGPPPPAPPRPAEPTYYPDGGSFAQGFRDDFDRGVFDGARLIRAHLRETALFALGLTLLVLGGGNVVATCLGLALMGWLVAAVLAHLVWRRTPVGHNERVAILEYENDLLSDRLEKLGVVQVGRFRDKEPYRSSEPSRPTRAWLHRERMLALDARGNAMLLDPNYRVDPMSLTQIIKGGDPGRLETKSVVL